MNRAAIAALLVAVLVVVGFGLRVFLQGPEEVEDGALSPPGDARVDVSSDLEAFADAAAAGRNDEAYAHLQQALARGVVGSELPWDAHEFLATWNAPPSLTITSPRDGEVLTDLVVRVQGRLETLRDSDTVLLRGGSLHLGRDGSFDVEHRFMEPGTHDLRFEVVSEGRHRLPERIVRVTAKRPAQEMPGWARTLVSAAQVAAAEKHGAVVALENPLGMRFVLVPAGSFWMGSPEDESGHEDDETRHKVTLSEPFYLQVREVTNAQYRRYRPAYDSGSLEVRNVDESLDSDQQPVVQVTLNGALAFARWLTEIDGTLLYGLPTEAQWEYACRAGTSTPYAFGDRESDLARYANFADRNHPTAPGRRDLDDGYALTAPVGCYPSNDWGFQDMHGNVWEWCRDGYGAYETEPVTDPRGPVSASGRVIRGGSWASHPQYVRSAYRLKVRADHRGDDCGFRLTAPLPTRTEH